MEASSISCRAARAATGQSNGNRKVKEGALDTEDVPPSLLLESPGGLHVEVGRRPSPKELSPVVGRAMFGDQQDCVADALP